MRDDSHRAYSRKLNFPPEKKINSYQRLKLGNIWCNGHQKINTRNYWKQIFIFCKVWWEFAWREYLHAGSILVENLNWREIPKRESELAGYFQAGIWIGGKIEAHQSGGTVDRDKPFWYMYIIVPYEKKIRQSKE